jgi:RNA polymerase sigma-70 factor (ECF subfamily)
MRLSDDGIIENIGKGEKRQFALLIDRYKDRAMTLAVRMVRNREDAEEIVQDAFVRAYNGLEKFQGSAKFSTWLYRIVYNLCLTKIGRNKTVPAAVDVNDAEETIFEDEEGIDPHTELESKQLIALVRTIIDAMPERYASVLSLFYFQELSYDEICNVTQLPLGTVKAHLFRARNMLQSRIMQELKHEYASHE